MTEITLIKSQLINELWLPITKQAGSILYPRLKDKQKNENINAYTS